MSLGFIPLGNCLPLNNALRGVLVFAWQAFLEPIPLGGVRFLAYALSEQGGKMSKSAEKYSLSVINFGHG